MFRPMITPCYVILGSLPLIFAPPPVAAQTLAPKDAWDILASFLDGTGGQLTSAGLVRDGEALVARNARLSFDGMVEIRFNDLRLEQQGEGVSLVPSEQFQVTSYIGAGNERRDYAITHDGGLVLSANDTLAELALQFPRFEFVKTAATRDGQPLDEQLRMVATGLTGRLGLGLVAPHSFSIDLDVTELAQTVVVNDPMLMLAQNAEGTTQAINLSVVAEGLEAFDTEATGWMGRAFDNGLSARVSMSSGETRMRMDQTVAGMAMSFDLTGGRATLEASLADGMLTLNQESSAFHAPMTVMGVPVDLNLARFELALGMPLVVTPDDREFGLRFGFQDLTVDEPALALIGAQDFAGEPVTVELDLSARGRWLVEITEDPDPEQVPVDLVQFDLTRLALGVGAALLTGEGSFAMEPGALARAGDGPPDGEGNFVFDLRGGNALMARLVAAGLIPPDQQFVAQAMMGAMGRSVGEDHLRSEVAIRPGPQVTVNGMPLPF